MRIWHTKLIPVLPRQQLLRQWRELNSIFKKQDKHILINFIYDEVDADLQMYTSKVIKEMQRRKYRVNLQNMEAYFGGGASTQEMIDFMCEFDCYDKKMTDRYLRQCYYNLQEKYDCGGITEEEWQRIESEVEI